MKWIGFQIEKILAVNKERYELKLRFSDKAVGIVSLKELFDHPKGVLKEVLRGDLFDKCFIESGALAWPNGLELCPDQLRRMMESQKKARAA